MNSESLHVNAAYLGTLSAVTKLLVIVSLTCVTVIAAWVATQPYFSAWARSTAICAFGTMLLITIDYWRLPKPTRQLRLLGLALILTGLLGYILHGGLSIGAPVLFFGMTCLSISSKPKLILMLLVTTSACILIINFFTRESYLIGIASDGQIDFFNESLNQWLSILNLAVTLIGCFVLITPLRALASKLHSQFSQRANSNRNLTQQAQIATEMLFKSLRGATLQLNPAGFIETASSSAVDLLGSTYKEMIHYSDTTLITLAQLPQFIAQARETGYSYTFTVPWQDYLDPPAAITVTPFRTARGERCTIISIQASMPGTRPSGDALARQQLTQLSFNLALNEHCVLIIRLCSQDHESEEAAERTLVALKVQLEHSTNEKFKLLEINATEYTLLTTAASLSRFETIIKTLQHLQEKFASNNAHVAIGIASGSVESDSIISVYERSQVACRHAQERHLSAYVDYSTTELSDWDPNERSLLKHAIGSSKLKLQLLSLTRLNSQATELNEFKLVLDESLDGRYRHGELLRVINYYRLTKELDEVQRYRTLEILSSLDSQPNLTPAIIRVPDEFITDIQRLNQALIDMNNYKIPFDLVWFRINEHIATGLSASHWQLLQELRSRGVHFILSNVGQGDTDLRLFCDPLFEMVQFSNSMCVNMDSNAKQREIIKTFLSLAQSLDKKTIVRWSGSDRILQLLAEFGVDYIDTY